MAPVLKTGRARALVGSNPTPSASSLTRTNFDRHSSNCFRTAEMRTPFDWRGALRARVKIPPLRDLAPEPNLQHWIIPCVAAVCFDCSGRRPVPASCERGCGAACGSTNRSRHGCLYTILSSAVRLHCVALKRLQSEDGYSRSPF
jgi:hypothetical protein